MYVCELTKRKYRGKSPRVIVGPTTSSRSWTEAPKGTARAFPSPAPERSSRGHG